MAGPTLLRPSGRRPPTPILTPTPTPTNAPPVVAITQPETDSGQYDAEYRADSQDGSGYYKEIVLQGIATDLEDDVLSDPSLVWTTEHTDMQKDPLGTGIQVTARLYLQAECSGSEKVGTLHKITLTGTDSGGKVASAVRMISIWIDCVY